MRSPEHAASAATPRFDGGYMNSAEFSAPSRSMWTRNLSRRIFGTGMMVGALVFVVSCNQAGTAPGAKQHASVLLRDGSTVTGTVTASSGSEITLAGDDSQTHTLQMAQVKSIEYDDANAPGSAAAPAAGQPAGAPADQSAAAPANPNAG